MNYTNDKEQIVFLRDADIANSLDGKTISSENILSNGVPSFELFKKKYEELSTYDNNICAYIKDGVEVSVQNLCTEITNLRTETDVLSTNICTSVDYISGFVKNTISSDLYKLSAGTKETSSLLSDQINALWEDVKGGVNYKGHLYNFEGAKPFGKNLDLSGIFALKYNLYNTETWTLSANKTFNNGWLYNVTLTGDYAVSGYVTNDGVSVENNDYFIIHNKDLSCVDVSCISRDTIDIIEAVQNDYVRFALLKQISNFLSTDYVGKIATLSDALSSDIDSLSNKLCAEINTLSTRLSNDVVTISTDLSNRINDLSDSISNTVKISVDNLQDQISSNDNDIEFLSNSVSVEVQRNLDSVHRKKDIVVNSEDHTIRTTLKRTFGDVYDFRVGYLTRFPSAHTMTNEDASWSYDFEENDFILFKKTCSTTTVDETCFDIVKDYDKEIERKYNNLCSQIFDVSTFISNDITYISGYVKNTISADLYKLSNEVSAVSTSICISANQISTTVKNISVGLSTYIDSLELSTNGISTIVTSLSNTLCADIKDLSANLSTDIDAKYNDLTTQINATSSYISGEVAKNDIDIANIQNYISGSNSLCTELSDVKYHYNKTFTEQKYTKGGSDIDVDVLNVVNSEDLEQKFVLVYLSGTLVLSSL